MRQDELEIIASYWYPHEAALAKSKLEAYGVEAWLFDETQVRLRWYMAEALGGVKLAVKREDAYSAREILGPDHSPGLESIPEAALRPDPDELCAFCGADALVPVRDHTSLGVLRRMFGGKRRWRCSSCGRDQ